jgi:hypothetical protein
MSGKDQVERGPHRRQVGIVDRSLGIGGSVPGSEQQPILLAEGNLQLLQDAQQHVPSGPRAARLDEAQMPGGDSGLERQVELGHTPALAPLAQKGSYLGLGANRCHRR